MKAVERRIRLDIDRPVTADLGHLEQRLQGCIRIAEGRVTFRRTLSKALQHLSRLAYPAHARVDSRDARAVAGPWAAPDHPRLLIECEGLVVFTHLIVDIGEASVC